MAADDDSGGSGIGGKVGPLPKWGWALVIGGLVGLVYFVRQGKGSTTDPAKTQAYGDSNDERTTVLPVNSGLANEQYQALLDAIKGLQGAGSAPANGTPLPPAIGAGSGANRNTPILTGPPRGAVASGTTAILHNQ